MNMQRRSFLTYFSVGWVASCFPLVLSACSGDSKTATGEKTDGEKTDSIASPSMAGAAVAASATGFKVIGTVAQLDKAGSIGLDKILVIRNPADKTKLMAVNSTCTHKGCAVKWEAAEKTFECPCHDAHYAPDGKVKSGPAPKPLTTYSAKIEGGKVLVKTT
jgi:cytochrome b6-f complex iron-sulfur subunit